MKTSRFDDSVRPEVSINDTRRDFTPASSEELDRRQEDAALADQARRARRDGERAGWECPTCSGTAPPPSWVKVKAEWGELTDLERKVAKRLFSGLLPCKELPKKGSRKCVTDAIGALLPTFRDAWEVAGDGVCRFLIPDEEEGSMEVDNADG